MDPGSGVVIGTCSGILNATDARKGAAAYWANPDCTGRPVVWDFRSARLDVHPPEIEALARFILESQPPAPPPRVAFVTARDVDFGLSRMFEVHREHPATLVKVFRDYDEAVRWAMEHRPTAKEAR
jgi:hypothetical protein